VASALQIVEPGAPPYQYHPEAVEAIDQLYSPYCPGWMLAICAAPESAILRDSINNLAVEGWSSEELVEWMVANHGETYRAVPLREGWGIWAWVLPPAGLILGLSLIVLFLRRQVRRGGANAEVRRDQRSAAASSVVSGEEEEKLRSAIREIELHEDPSF
jgi:cytochrome c-type biogenesis protein CcmH/NrfF